MPRLRAVWTGRWGHVVHRSGGERRVHCWLLCACGALSRRAWRLHSLIWDMRSNILFSSFDSMPRSFFCFSRPFQVTRMLYVLRYIVGLVFIFRHPPACCISVFVIWLWLCTALQSPSVCYHISLNYVVWYGSFHCCLFCVYPLYSLICVSVLSSHRKVLIHWLCLEANV